MLMNEVSRRAYFKDAERIKNGLPVGYKNSSYTFSGGLKVAEGNLKGIYFEVRTHNLGSIPDREDNYDDMASETIMRISKAHGWNDKNVVSSFSLVKWRVLDTIRKIQNKESKHRKEMISLDSLGDRYDILENRYSSQDFMSPDVVLEHKEVHDLQNILTSEELEVIGGVFGLWGFFPRSQADIAWSLEKSEGYVSGVKSRALAKLRRHYQVEEL
jgi:DNA-directed RNA polymerase specialized sigma subunit